LVVSTRRVWLLIECADGIGRALAQTVLQRSGDCLVCAVHDTESVSDLGDLPPDRFMAVRADVTDCTSIAAAMEAAVARFGAVDIIVDCAGAELAGSIEQSQEKRVRDVFDVNFFGVLNVAQAVMPYLRRRGRGRLAAITSVNAFLGRQGCGVESASRAAALTLLESLAAEARPSGVHVTAIAAGPGHLGHAAERQFVAQSIIANLTLPEPPTYLVLGRDCMATVDEKLNVLSQLMLGTLRKVEEGARPVRGLADWSSSWPLEHLETAQALLPEWIWLS